MLQTNFQTGDAAGRAVQPCSRTALDSRAAVQPCSSAREQPCELCRADGVHAEVDDATRAQVQGARQHAPAETVQPVGRVHGAHLVVSKPASQSASQPASKVQPISGVHGMRVHGGAVAVYVLYS